MEVELWTEDGPGTALVAVLRAPDYPAGTEPQIILHEGSAYQQWRREYRWRYRLVSSVVIP